MAGWIDRWRAATVAIGAIQEADIRSRTGRVSTKKFFAVVGTGVLFSLHGPRRQDCWLVTARHVFLDPTENWTPSTLGIVFPHIRRHGPKQSLEIPIHLTKAGRRCWYPHPDKAVDLACLPLPLTMRHPKPGGPSSIAWMDIATTADLYEGVPIMVLGYPAAFDIPDSPRAIVRQGIVSWVSPARPGSEVFLIDSHVFPGNSGGTGLPASHRHGSGRASHCGRGGHPARHRDPGQDSELAPAGRGQTGRLVRPRQ